MANLLYDFRNLTRHNRDGSQATQKARQSTLVLVSSQLKELGFNQLRASKLKLKHVKKLIELWQSQDLSSGTNKNRMSHIRWVSEKVEKPHMIPIDNKELGIGNRKYITNQDKSIDSNLIERIENKNIKLSLRLQKEFGLRREESIKFNVNYAHQGEFIKLKNSWCKGGRARQIPITTTAQKELLTEIRNLVSNSSLIPQEKRYIEQLNAYNYLLRKEKISKAHGLRHLYAQNRYKELTGFSCPAGGGKVRKELLSCERALDKQARQVISQELGHNREEITSVYLGV